MNEKIKIILADDEVLFRKGISFILSREEHIDILFEASNGVELIDYLAKSQSLPDIILMDLKMPELNGVEATKIIHKEYPSIKIIALTSYDTKSFIANMLDVGATSYLNKNTNPNDLLKTINEVGKNGFYYSEAVLKVIQDNTLTKKGSKSLFDTSFLSERETEVLQLICLQKNAAEIGEALFISTRTVEGHKMNLLLKTDSRNVAGLVVFAIQNEIVKLNGFA